MFRPTRLTIMAAGTAMLASGCVSMAQQQALRVKSNTQVVLAFEDMVFNKHQVSQAFAKYVGPTYTQHNPHVADGKEAAIAGLRYLVKTQYPNTRIYIKRTVAEGDLVAVHLLGDSQPGQTRGEAVVDIFRLENGKIVEHWDVVQAVPEKSANSNTMF